MNRPATTYPKVQLKPELGDILRCVLLTVASAPLAWLGAKLLSHRTLGGHEQIGTIAFTVVVLGSAARYWLRSWRWTGLFLIGMLLFPSVLDHRCLLLGSGAVPIIAALALDRWVGGRWYVILGGSALACLLGVAGASALLSHKFAPPRELLSDAWGVQWSMWGEEQRFAQAKQEWNAAMAQADVKELEQKAGRELAAIRVTEQEAHQKEHADSLSDAIALYRRAIAHLAQARELVAAVKLWEGACAAGDRKSMLRYARAGLLEAESHVAQAEAHRLADHPEESGRQYAEAAGLLHTVDEKAKKSAEEADAARQSWEHALGNVDQPRVGKYTRDAFDQSKSKAVEADATDGRADVEGAVRLYREATDLLKIADAQARQKAEQVAAARGAWEKMLAGVNQKLVREYTQDALDQAVKTAAAAADKDAAGQADAAVQVYQLAATMLRELQIAALLADAKANDSKERGKVALAALDELLKLDPANAAALALREKIHAYYDPSKIGDTVANSLGMRFAYIPAGEFDMGSPTTEVGRLTSEIPHHVKITQPFLMGIHHVTRAQFAAFVKESAYRTDAEKEGSAVAWAGDRSKTVSGATWRNPGFDQADDHPVVEISWNDAVAFCQWLSRKEGKHYRLPTEAEWEYACRAGTRTAYFWGENPDGGNGWANCMDLTFKEKFSTSNASIIKYYASKTFNWSDNYVFTSPAGKFKPNAWGLFDMIGNARTWCADFYGPYTDREAVDPSGPSTGNDKTSRRVIRGASWYSISRLCRCAYRAGLPYASRNATLGFRVCLDLK